MGSIEIKPGIHWVGAIDWAVRDFHGYITPNGTTYNNYLILDKHVTLVDTVKHDFSEYTVDSILGLVDPGSIGGPRVDREHRDQPYRERPRLKPR
ncbi:MAG: roo [Nitrospirae bacterium]|nr:roo [Nitrospirota bacterium]